MRVKLAKNRSPRWALLVALTAWAWPVWLLGWLVYMFVQLCAVAVGRRP